MTSTFGLIGVRFGESFVELSHASYLGVGIGLVIGLSRARFPLRSYTQGPQTIHKDHACMHTRKCKTYTAPT